MDISLLLTDIEGSTRLLAADGEAYGRALRQHHEIIRAHAQAHGGRECLDVGDGFYLAFADPLAAARAALGMQQDLATAAWPAECGPLRVRMALHRGAAELREGQYRGAAVHLAARLLAAAHGGQILASRPAREAAPAVDLAWQALGTYRLRGFPEPEAIHQLGRGGFPAPLADHARRHNVPPPKDVFVGRAARLHELERLLAPTAADRLVTLTGPGGMGKTRLATEAALRLLEAYDHGVLFVPLARVADAGLIHGAVLEALGRPAAVEPLPQLVAALGRSPCLLILDNFEQFPAEGAAALAALRQALPAARFLVTSRSRLGLDGEREMPLEALEVPAADSRPEAIERCDGARLFLERARHGPARSTLDAGSAPVLAEICRLLDGLPLAIELAAARLPVLTLPELLAALREDFAGFGRDPVPGVPATLQAVLEWSRSLLPAEIAALFETLSVFRGGATALTLAEVHGAPPRAALAGLHYLLTCSLVRTAETAGRLRFEILEPIRQVAEAGGGPSIATAREKHSAYYRQLVRRVPSEFQTAKEVALAAELDPEVGNILAAIDRAPSAQTRIASAYNFQQYALQRPANRALRPLLIERPGDGPVAPKMLGHAWHTIGALDLQWQELAGAEDALALAQRFYEEAAAEDEAASAQFNRAIVAARRGDAAGAYAIYAGTLARFRQRGLVSACARILVHMGNQARDLGRFADAIGHLEEATRLCEPAGDLATLADAQSTLGATLEAWGRDPAAAAGHIRRALDLKMRLGQLDVHPLLATLASISIQAGDPRRTAFFWGAARAALARLGANCSTHVAARLQRAEDDARRLLPDEDWALWSKRGASASSAEWIPPVEAEALPASSRFQTETQPTNPT